MILGRDENKEMHAPTGTYDKRQDTPAGISNMYAKMPSSSELVMSQIMHCTTTDVYEYLGVGNTFIYITNNNEFAQEYYVRNYYFVFWETSVI